MQPLMHPTEATTWGFFQPSLQKHDRFAPHRSTSLLAWKRLQQNPSVLFASGRFIGNEAETQSLG